MLVFPLGDSEEDFSGFNCCCEEGWFKDIFTKSLRFIV